MGSEVEPGGMLGGGRTALAGDQKAYERAVCGNDLKNAEKDEALPLME